MVKNNMLHDHSGNANEVIKNMPSKKSFDMASSTFQLVSDASRLRILWLLSHCEVCVNNIAIAVNMSAPAVSHHLKILKQAGLIKSRRFGKEIYYKISSTKEAELVHISIDGILGIKCCK